jgi:hypothetical protein
MLRNQQKGGMTMTTETSLGRRICNISNKIRRSINIDVHGTLEPEGFGFNGPVIGFIGERQRDGEPVGLKDLEGCFGLTRSGASRLVSRLAHGGDDGGRRPAQDRYSDPQSP